MAPRSLLLPTLLLLACQETTARIDVTTRGAAPQSLLVSEYDRFRALRLDYRIAMPRLPGSFVARNLPRDEDLRFVVQGIPGSIGWAPKPSSLLLFVSEWLASGYEITGASKAPKERKCPRKSM